MDVLVDTSVWSLSLRRKNHNEKDPVRNRFEQLVLDGRVQIIGPIRQELLSGIPNIEQFSLLKEKLRAFEDIDLRSYDYETAAEMFNVCRKKGIQGSHVDFLICAVAYNFELKIFTTDNDFTQYKKHLTIELFN